MNDHQQELVDTINCFANIAARTCIDTSMDDGAAATLVLTGVLEQTIAPLLRDIVNAIEGHGGMQ